jgi:endosialidase-like protein
MNSSTHLKQTLLPIPIILILAFGLSPQARAVNPPPDGCYPGFTTAEGCNALQGLTTGQGNTGIGWFALSSAGDSSFSTGVGGGALALNTGDSNTAVGAAAMLLNTGGTLNVAIGTDAMVFNDSADNNTGVGAFALEDNVAGATNAAFGIFAAQHNTAAFNVAVGGFALQANVGGTRNTAVGAGAMEVGGGGDDNTAVGELAGNGITGTANTILGSGAGTGITSGGNNVCIGLGAGSNIATASGNVYIGNNVNPPGPDLEFNTIRIKDNSAQVAGTNSAVFIGGIFGSTIGGANAIVGVNANGQLGTAVSSARFKKDIESMGQSSEVIFSLRPVSFRYKGDETKLPCFGLIAEEVAKVNPDLILLDKEGKPLTVRYEQIDAMLLNEFLKEHKTVQELKSIVIKQETIAAQQQKQIETLTAGLQKVSAQLQVSKSAPQVVVNKP